MPCRSTLALLFALGVACGDSDDPGSDLAQTPADVDCTGCGDDVCWYEYDIEGDGYVGHCAPWPAQCDADRTCECLNTETDSNGSLFCEDFGVQNSNACSIVDDRPLVYCETNLG